LHKARLRLRELLQESASNPARPQQAPELAPPSVIEVDLPAAAPQPPSRAKDARAPSRSARPELRNLLPSRVH
jgi:hypothetical protein